MLYFTINLSIDKKQKKIMQKFILHITTQNFDFIKDNRFECFILAHDLSLDFKQKFVQKVKEAGKTVLGESAQDCLTYALDGVLIDLTKSDHIAQDYTSATQGLKGKFIGVISRNRRHEAMLISECEPDFIVFKVWTDGKEKLQDLTAWYAELFLIQSAIMPMESLDYRQFTSDFVILDDSTFLKPDFY